ncbi:hypothetical protein EPI10_016272 [Gossypium australe]|uniref:Uncharacterized protein n=1 Tax=Gossypium australe TaxID=47621 RepID=A0A5B6VNH4_9ROSI|nr:hypothetical protein EPI10_016272 [Gossypium australe]
MRPSCLAVSLLVFLIVLSSIEGIRLDKISKSMHPKLQEGSLMKNSNGVRGDDILCKEAHCRVRVFAASVVYISGKDYSRSKAGCLLSFLHVLLGL